MSFHKKAMIFQNVKKMVNFDLLEIEKASVLSDASFISFFTIY